MDLGHEHPDEKSSITGHQHKLCFVFQYEISTIRPWVETDKNYLREKKFFRERLNTTLKNFLANIAKLTWHFRVFYILLLLQILTIDVLSETMASSY